MNTNMEINAAELLEAPRKASLFKRVLSYFLCFLMFYYPVSPAWAQVLSDAWFESELSLNALFQPSDIYNTNALYEGALNISDEDLAKYESYPNVEDFFELTKDYERLDLSDPSYVPVMIGGNPIFVPTYPNQFLYQPQYESYPAVGTAFVQARIVSGQMRELLGRSLIDPENPIYADELTQLTTLYNNALDFARDNPLYEYGEPLKRHQDYNRESYDFIWPEVRMVQGQKVIVPVVYLSSQTVDDRKVEGIVNEVDGSITADSLVIDGVDLQMGRNSFIKLANDLINHQGEITSEGDLEIVAGGAVRNLSGTLSSEAGLSITAQHIENRTLVYRYDLEGTQGQYLGEIAAINSQNELELVSHGDIYFMAAAAAAGTDLTLDAGGDIWLGSEQLNDYGNIDQGGWNGVWSSVDHLVSKLSAGGTLSLIADGEIVIDAAAITSKGHIEILAGLGITVNSLTSSHQYSKGGKFGNTTKNIEAYKAVAMRALLDAGESITLHTEMGDLSLRATEISSVEGTHLSASNGSINLLVARENDHYSYSSVKKSSVRTVYRQQGHQIQSVAYPTIIGGLNTDALYGLNVEFGVDEADMGLSLEEQLDKLNGQEGTEWLQHIKDDPNVNWAEVETLYQEWNERQSALNPAVMAVIVIAVAIATSGSGLAAAMGTAGFNGATIMTALTGIGSSGVAGTIASAAFTTLVTQISIGVANGDGVNAIEDGLKFVVSDDYLKNLVVTAVTAGVMKQVNTEFLGGVSETLVETGVDGEKILSFSGQATQLLTRTVVQAGASTLIHGEGSSEFESLLIQNIAQNTVNELGEYMATEIGGAFDTDGAFDTAMKYISHAAAGCIIGAANAGIDGSSSESGCAAGSGGAVIGELVGDIYKNSDTFKAARAEANAFLLSQGGKAGELVEQYGYDDALKKLTEAQGKQSLYNAYINLKKAGADIAKLTAAITALAAGADAADINNAAGSAYTTAYYNSLGSDARDFARILGAIGQHFDRFEELSAQYGPTRSAIIVASEAAKEALVELHKSLTPEQQKSFTYTITIDGKNFNLNLAALGGVVKYLGATAEDLAFIVDFGLAGLTGDLESVVQHVDQLKQGVEEALDTVQNIDQMPEQILLVIDDLSAQGTPEADAAMGELLAGLMVSGVGVVGAVLTAGAGVALTAYAGKRLLNTLGNIRKHYSTNGLDTTNLDNVFDELLGRVDSNDLIVSKLNQLELNAYDELYKIEKLTKDAHFLKRHGPLTTLEQQQIRAETGYTPDGVQQKWTVDSGRWLSHEDMWDALHMAHLEHTKTGDSVVILTFDKIIGEGYLKGGEIYARTNQATFVFKDGLPFTFYPLLDPK